MSTTPKTIPGGSYVDAWPTGEYCALIVGSHVETHLGPIPLPPGESFGPVFLRCTPAGGFKMIGLSHDIAWTLFEWTQATGQWRAIPYGPPTAGNNPAIYSLTGDLIDAPIPIGDGFSSAGYRQVSAQNVPVLGQDTYFSPAMRLSEYSAAVDLFIGQGHDAGGVAVWDGNNLRLLWPGEDLFINVHPVNGSQITVSCWAHDLNASLIWQVSAAELRDLPLVVATPLPPPPAPTPIPPVVPSPPSLPEPNMDFPNHLNVVQRERAKYGATIDDATCFAITNAVVSDPSVAADGWGLTKAPAGGSGVVIGGQNYRTDKLCHPAGFINDILGSTGTGAASAQWGPNADPNGNASNWAPPVVLTPAPGPVVVPPAPPVDLGQITTREDAIVAAIQAASAANVAKLDELKTTFQASMADVKAQLPAVLTALVGGGSNVGSVLSGLFGAKKA